MGKILNNNGFLFFLSVILSSLVGFIIYDEYNMRENVKILNLLRTEADKLSTIEINFRALQQNEDIKADQNNESNNEIKNSEENIEENKDEKIIRDSLKEVTEEKKKLTEQVIKIFLGSSKKLSNADRISLMEMVNTYKETSEKYFTIYKDILSTRKGYDKKGQNLLTTKNN